MRRCAETRRYPLSIKSTQVLPLMKHVLCTLAAIGILAGCNAGQDVEVSSIPSPKCEPNTKPACARLDLDKVRAEAEQNSANLVATPADQKRVYLAVEPVQLDSPVLFMEPDSKCMYVGTRTRSRYAVIDRERCPGENNSQVLRQVAAYVTLESSPLQSGRTFWMHLGEPPADEPATGAFRQMLLSLASLSQKFESAE